MYISYMRWILSQEKCSDVCRSHRFAKCSTWNKNCKKHNFRWYFSGLLSIPMFFQCPLYHRNKRLRQTYSGSMLCVYKFYLKYTLARNCDKYRQESIIEF